MRKYIVWHVHIIFHFNLPFILLKCLDVCPGLIPALTVSVTVYPPVISPQIQGSLTFVYSRSRLTQVRPRPLIPSANIDTGRGPLCPDSN